MRFASLVPGVSPLTPKRAGCSLLAALALLGCEPPLPADSYAPEDLRVVSVTQDAGRSLADASTTVMLGTGPGGGGTDAGTMSGGTDASTAAQTPLEKLQAALVGQYWLRVDVLNTSRGSGITVSTTATTYFVGKVGFDADGKLKLVQRQCAISLMQSGGAKTTIAPAGQQARVPARHLINLDLAAKTWSMPTAFYAMGWEYDFGQDPDRDVPRSDSDPLLYDPDGGGDGIDVSVTAGVTCKLRLVQKVGFSFSGTLNGNEFGAGSADSTGTAEYILKKDALCPTDAEKLSSGPDTVKLMRATVDDNLTCPSLSQFQAKL